MRKKRLLITGGSGFIGKNLTAYFAKTCRLFSPTHTQLDLLDGQRVHSFIAEHAIEYIIHAANFGGKRSDTDKKNTIETNLRIFFNVVRNAGSVKKIIYFGSGAEYDKSQPIVNVREKDVDRSVPADPYGFYKYVCAKYVENLPAPRRSRATWPAGKIVCLRLFGVYGPYEDYLVRFISNAIVKNLLSLPIDMQQNVFFDYLYSDDLMRIVAYILHHSMKYTVYNAVSGRRIDLLTIAHHINRISSFRSKILISQPGLHNEYTASNARLLKELKDFSFTPIDRGIRALFKWYRENISSIDKALIVGQQADVRTY